MSIQLAAPVGRADVTRVQNLKVDVSFVQALLKRVAKLKGNTQYDPGKIDGRIGRDHTKSATVNAITAFQTHFMKMAEPDSVVDKTRKPGSMIDKLISNAFLVGNVNLRIVRTEQHSESIIGALYCNGHYVCHTLELPWKDNKNDVSCVPSGSYNAYLRYDSVKKNREWVPQLKNVPGRTAIQIHIANFPKDILGCTAVGVTKGRNSVGSSTTAFQLLQDQIFGEGFTRQQIRAAKPKHGIVRVTYEYQSGRRWDLKPGERLA